MPNVLPCPRVLAAHGSFFQHQTARRSHLSFHSQRASKFASSNCSWPLRFCNGYATITARKIAVSPSYNLISLLPKRASTSCRFFPTEFAAQTRFSSSEQSPRDRNNDESGNVDPAAGPSPSGKPRLRDRLPIPVHENIYTIPNILTFSRLAVAPLIGYFIVNQNPVLALSFFIYAAATDLVDGWIARKLNQQTVVGTVIDPMADKTLMTVGVVCLAMNASIPVWLAGLILSRDVGLGLAAFYYRWISLPPPKTMARYWDFSLPSAEVKPTSISKVNTALQLGLLGTAMTMPVLPEAFLTAWNVHQAMTGLEYLVALTTVWSGMSYVYSKDAVKILNREEIEAKAAEKKKAAGKETKDN